ncbi:PTPA-CTERM sorting domain-containing protein [Leptolyngbya sp. FACHB-711]|uniref:PTPA-CTERM sorting domain-containing protein n=1 Tax=Leptolyngbya sp. FACHB-711 TaxID=2692813 RepID=UPI001686BCB2|nr:PTPA-CTERM sorting domain-containing protein [Leptolyngbya sp. FACHB-711]MBD2023169.1 PTPA-CTERM sorting domain-containing protein [Leptolyngbya sp. FACHB-711]
MKKQFLTGALALSAVTVGSFALSRPAEAFALSISPVFGSTENTGSTALLDFNFSQSGSDTLLNLGIANTTNGSAGLGATQSTLVGIGFDLPSIVAGGTYNPLASAFTQLYNDNASFITPTNGATDEGAADLSPFGSFNAGIRSAGPGNFAGGNPQQGLTAGQSTTVRFLFSSINAITLEQAFLSGFQNGSLRSVGRFQQVNAGGGSDKVLGGIPTTPIPTPALLPAALGMSAALFRKKKQEEKAAKATQKI